MSGSEVKSGEFCECCNLTLRNKYSCNLTPHWLVRFPSCHVQQVGGGVTLHHTGWLFLNSAFSCNTSRRERRHVCCARTFAQCWLACPGFCPPASLQWVRRTLGETWSLGLYFSGNNCEMDFVFSNLSLQKTCIRELLEPRRDNFFRGFLETEVNTCWSSLLPATDTGGMVGQELTLLSVAGAEPVTYKWWDDTSTEPLFM